MKFGSQNTDKITLVPHSGIQFYTLGFDLQTMPQFARSFIGHKFLDQARPDGTVPMELLAGWNEDDPEGEPPHQVTGDDDEYRIAKDKAVDTFLDRWIPVPFLAVRPGLDAQGREILEFRANRLGSAADFRGRAGRQTQRHADQPLRDFRLRHRNSQTGPKRLRGADTGKCAQSARIHLRFAVLGCDALSRFRRRAAAIRQGARDVLGRPVAVRGLRRRARATDRTAHARRGEKNGRASRPLRRLGPVHQRRGARAAHKAGRHLFGDATRAARTGRSRARYRQ